MCEENRRTLHNVSELNIGDLVVDQKTDTSYIVIHRSITLSEDFSTAICMEQLTFWKALAENTSGEITMDVSDIPGMKNIIELNPRNCCFYSKILGEGYKKMIRNTGKITLHR